MTYSVVVAGGSQQATMHTIPTAATSSSTNITFGGQTNPFYLSQTSFLNLTANQTTGAYLLSTSQTGVLGLGFG
jgi:hypothetical protein